MTSVPHLARWAIDLQMRKRHPQNKKKVDAEETSRMGIAAWWLATSRSGLCHQKLRPAVRRRRPRDYPSPDASLAGKRRSRLEVIELCGIYWPTLASRASRMASHSHLR